MRTIRIEIRNNSVLLDGYVNAVGRDSRRIPKVDGKMFKEQMEPKVFERALKKTDNVDLLLNHNKARKLGSTKAGNLELYEDNIGLRAVCTVTDAEIIKKAEKGELRGWSFGFVPKKDRWEDIDGSLQRRYVEEIELHEVSIVDNTRVPAYFGTSIEKRAEDEVLVETRSEDFKAIIENRSINDDISLFTAQLELLKLKKD